MKLLKLTIFSALLLTSLQSLAGIIFCGKDKILGQAMGYVNSNLRNYTVTSTSVAYANNEYIVCASAN